MQMIYMLVFFHFSFSSHSHEQALKSTRDELMTNRHRMLAMEEENKKSGDLIRQLKKRVLLLTKVSYTKGFQFTSIGDFEAK